MAIVEWAKPSLQVPSYRYESRLTSTPGPESFLRYSPQGCYLAFSQSNSNRSQMDLAIYDQQTQSVHLIKAQDIVKKRQNGRLMASGLFIIAMIR